MVENEVFGARSMWDTLTDVVIPDERRGASILEAPAFASILGCYRIHGVVKEVSNWAWLLFAAAGSRKGVPKLVATTLFWGSLPFTLCFVPEPTAFSGLIIIWQANALVSPVVVVITWVAIKRQRPALAPGHIPVSGCVVAVLWVAQTGTGSRVPSEAIWASLGRAEALACFFVPNLAWQAVLRHGHAAARPNVESQRTSKSTVVCLPVGIRVAIEWNTLTRTGVLIPVLGSFNTKCISESVWAIFPWATAFAS